MLWVDTVMSMVYGILLSHMKSPQIVKINIIFLVNYQNVYHHIKVCIHTWLFLVTYHMPALYPIHLMVWGLIVEYFNS